MIMTPHVLAGAALGSLFMDKSYAIPLAFLVGIGSHYALDAVPHWERLFGQHYNDKLPRNHNDWPRNILVQGAVDIFIGLLLLRYFTQVAPINLAWCIFSGGIGAALPDVIDNMPFWSKLTKSLPILNSAQSLHRFVHISRKKQRSYPKYTGLITQIAVSATSVLMLLLRK